MVYSQSLLTEEELRQIQITGSNLHCWQGKGGDAIRKVIKEMGFVQLDPLNPAGRYHDIFFFARIPDYSFGQFEKIAYPERLVFETYFHNLNAISIEYFPFFYSYSGREHLGRYYSRLLTNLEKLGGTNLLEEVYEYVQSHGSTKSSDLTEFGKADPKYASWKSNRNSGTALELLWAIGKLAIVERDGNFRKIYNLIERYVDKSLLIKSNYTDEERQLYRLKLKLKSFPVISIGKITETKKGKLKSNKKLEFNLNKIRLIEEEEDRYSPALVKTEGDFGYIVPSNWSKLVKMPLDDAMRVIGPLDPVIWDREQLKQIFDFNYIWEVYKKAKDRIWGYYVYPLLYNGEFIGRMEAKFDKKSKMLKIFNFQKVEKFDFDNTSEKALVQLLIRWKEMLAAKQIVYDDNFPVNF